ncbi:MAG: hypothetical protein ABI647_24035 [Gemmatimonadota bacterium]
MVPAGDLIADHARGGIRVTASNGRESHPLTSNAAGLLETAIAGRRHMPNMYEAMRTITYKDDGPEAWSGVSMDWLGIHSHHADVERAATPIQSWARWMDAGTNNSPRSHRFPVRSFHGRGWRAGPLGSGVRG